MLKIIIGFISLAFSFSAFGAEVWTASGSGRCVDDFPHYCQYLHGPVDFRLVTSAELDGTRPEFYSLTFTMHPSDAAFADNVSIIRNRPGIVDFEFDPLQKKLFFMLSYAHGYKMKADSMGWVLGFADGQIGGGSYFAGDDVLDWTFSGHSLETPLPAGIYLLGSALIILLAQSRIWMRRTEHGAAICNL